MLVQLNLHKKLNKKLIKVSWVWLKKVQRNCSSGSNQGWDDSLLKMHVVRVGCHLFELHRNSQSRHCNLDGDAVNPDGWGCLRHPDRAGNRYWDSIGTVWLESSCVFSSFLSPFTLFICLCMLSIWRAECFLYMFVCTCLERVWHLH